MRYERFIALRHIQAGSKSRTLSVISSISIIGVLLGVGVTDVVLSVTNGFQNDLRKKILGATAHVIVLKYYNEGISDYEELEKKLRKEESVISAIPFTFHKSVVKAGKYADGIVVRGFSLKGNGKEGEIEKLLVSGSFDFDNKPKGIVLGNELATRLHIGVGDTVALVSPFSGTENPLGFIPKMGNFEVIGIFRSGFYDYDANWAYLGLKTAQEFFEMGNTVSGFEIYLSDLNKAPVIAKRIVKNLGGYPFRANDWIELNKNLFSALKLEKITMFIILSLIVIVAAFGIAGTLIMSVYKKTKEIGILRAMGADSRFILKIFVWEGMLIGIIGTVLGSIIGGILSWLIGKFNFITIPGDVYFIDKLPSKMEIVDFFMVAGAALLVSFLATLYPAWRASCIVPVEAVRYE